MPHSPTGKVDAENTISSLMIKVSDGYSVKDIAGYINIHQRKIRAVTAKSMTSDVSDSLSGITKIVKVLIVVMWILCVTMMMIVFSMIMNERKKEFAILRMVGVSEKRLASLIVSESVILGVSGGIIGIATVMLFGISFKNLIQESLGLPYLMPEIVKITILCVMTLVISAASAAAASAMSAIKISRQDTGLILRDEN